MKHLIKVIKGTPVVSTEVIAACGVVGRLVEENFKQESFIDAHFSSFIEAKEYFEFLCNKDKSRDRI